MDRKGIVYWITGLSGAGKTTIASGFYKELKKFKSNVFFLDGDHMREVFGNDLGYTLDDRLKCALRYSRLCKALSDQGIDVVCATVSMFDKCRNWNRKEIENYKEIYIKVNLETLRKRNKKNLFSYAEKDKIKNVVGIDLGFDEPKQPDLVLDNDNSLQIRDQIKKICKFAGLIGVIS